MKNYTKRLVILFVLLFNLIFITSCSNPKKGIKTIKDKNYELKIAEQQKAVLILYPCFPCDLENTKSEASFLKDIEKEGITTLLLNRNQKLFLNDAEKMEFAKELNTILDANHVEKKNVFIGGFSGGGNISILLSNYLLKTKNQIQPKGVFAVDSPIDLEKLYSNAKKDISRNIYQEGVEEARYIIAMLEKDLGKPDDNKEKYAMLSPFLLSVNSTNNITILKDVKTRFYYELDLKNQLEKTGRKYDELNAYQLEKFHEVLTNMGAKNSNLIVTKNRGYRADGSKNTHTWNLVERESLVKWMLN